GGGGRGEWKWAGAEWGWEVAIDGRPSNVPSIAAETVPEYVTSSPRFEPWLMPETTSTGGSGNSPSTPRFTQSDGVPLTANRRSPNRSTRSGRWSVSACPTALCSRSGAITYTSPTDSSAPASTASPAACMPSSLVTRIVTDMSAQPLESRHEQS